MALAIRRNPFYGLVPQNQHPKDSTRRQCEYEKECSAYDAKSPICTNSTSSGRYYCGLYRKHCAEDTICRQIGRTIEKLLNLVGEKKGDKSS